MEIIPEIQKIEKLIYNDQDFKKITRHVKRNDELIFEIICKENDELTFSRTLKYFLDPSGRHHFKDLPLKQFLKALILKDRKNNNVHNLSLLYIDTLDMDQARVYREYSLNEYGRVDIVIDLAPNIFCMIEVKLHSDEGENQTKGHGVTSRQWPKK